MAFYDGLGKRIQQTGQEAVERTKKGAESVRINNSISNLEREITKEYTELGRIYYQKHAGDEQDADLIPYFQRINDKMESIQSYRNQLNDLKGMRKCPSCGKSIGANVTFCNFCGARQVPEYTAPTQPTSGKTCPNCGAEVKEGQRFCTECGTLIEASQSAAKADSESTGDVSSSPAYDPEVEAVLREEMKADAAPESPEVEEPVISEEIEAEESDIAKELEEVEEPAITEEAEDVPSTQDTIETEEIKEDDTEKAEAWEEQKEEDESPAFCTNCGEKLEPGDLFCTNCGQKVE